MGNRAFFPPLAWTIFKNAYSITILFFLVKIWSVGLSSTKVYGDKTKVICANSEFELRNVNVGEVAWV